VSKRRKREPGLRWAFPFEVAPPPYCVECAGDPADGVGFHAFECSLR
jgi:hypothetical protein